MLFLGPLYSFLASRYATSINHFALVKLTLQGLDKTIFYFLIFVLVRLCWLLLIRKRRSVQSEFGVWLFAFYFILVLMLTTFRYTYFPWELNFHWDRSLDNVNFVFLKNTWKMIYAPSKVDFYYNSLGNILAFVPFGLLVPNLLRQKACFWRVLISGMLSSISIEILQFLLLTGVSDVDDVFFNTCGILLGYSLYKLVQICVKNRKKTSNVRV